MECADAGIAQPETPVICDDQFRGVSDEPGGEDVSNPIAQD